MRIDLTTRAPEPGEAAQPAKSSTSKAGISGPSEAGRDQARLSPDGMRIQKLEAAVNRLPEVRREKVEALQRAVREGRYAVGAEQIADALFHDWLTGAARLR